MGAADRSKQIGRAGPAHEVWVTFAARISYIIVCGLTTIRGSDPDRAAAARGGVDGPRYIFYRKIRVADLCDPHSGCKSRSSHGRIEPNIADLARTVDDETYRVHQVFASGGWS